jgi:hypothetical protein
MRKPPCPVCGIGRMLFSSSRVVGFSRVVYRKCSNPLCGKTARPKLEHIDALGIEISSKSVLEPIQQTAHCPHCNARFIPYEQTLPTIQGSIDEHSAAN